MSTGSKTKAPYFETSVSVDTEVDVEISPDELRKAGWHHKSECGGADEPELPVPLIVGALSYRDVVGSLHRQAHPAQHRDALMCREEPCRSLSFADLNVRMGRPA